MYDEKCHARKNSVEKVFDHVFFYNIHLIDDCSPYQKCNGEEKMYIIVTSPLLLFSKNILDFL